MYLGEISKPTKHTRTNVNKTYIRRKSRPRELYLLPEIPAFLPSFRRKRKSGMREKEGKRKEAKYKTREAWEKSGAKFSTTRYYT